VLPKNVVVVAEESVFDHFGLVLLPQELGNLVGVAHAQRLRFLERVHKVRVECFPRVPDNCVRHRVVFIVEDQAPRGLLAFPLQAHRRIKLHANRKVPLQRLLVVLEPHLSIVVKLVLRSILVEQGLHFHEHVENVVFPRCHDLQRISKSRGACTGYLRRDCAASAS